MISKGKLWYAALMLIFAASMTIAACKGSSGGGATTGTTQSTTTTINGTSQSVTAAATVTGTGTTGATTVTGLPIAEKISVVTSSSTKPKMRPLPGASSFDAILGAIPWATTVTNDYNSDPQFVYVHDRAQDAFKQTNEILCSVGQTEYTSMTNKGAYLALVDKNQCSQNRDSAKSAGQSSQNQTSGSSAPSYEKWTMISNRADNSSPQVVSAWVHTDMGSGKSASTPAVIIAKLVVAKTETELPPYGLFTMNFEAYPEDSTTHTAVTTGGPMMTGYLRTVVLSDNSVVLQFYNSHKEPIGTGNSMVSLSEASTLLKSSATAGKGEVSFPDYDTMWSTTGCASTGGCTTSNVPYKRWRFAYDGATFNRQEVNTSDTTYQTMVAGTAVCLDQTQKASTAWRYGGYYGKAYTDTHNVAHTAGSRVELNSGFPVLLTDSNGDHQGYVGFYGMWFPDNPTITSGTTTVKKFDYSNGTATGTTYTVYKTAGKLMKHSKVQLTLADIKGVPLQYDGMDPGTGNWGQFEVKWDGTALKAVKYMDQTNWLWKNVATPFAVTVNQWDNSFNFWSRSLGGDGRIEFARCTKTDADNVLANSATYASINNCQQAGDIKGSVSAGKITPVFTSTTKVVFNKVDVIYRGDSALGGKTLACFDNCPNGAAIQAANANVAQTAYTSAAYADTSWGAWDPNNPNLGTVNQNISPAKVALCEGKTNATIATCASTTENWNAPQCNGSNGTAGVQCCGLSSTPNAMGWYDYVCPTSTNYGGYYGYSFDATNYTLTDKLASAATGLTVSPSAMTDAQFGYSSGPLFDSALLADNSSTSYSWYDYMSGSTKTGSFQQSITCDWPYDYSTATWDQTLNNGAGGFSGGKYGTCAWRLSEVLNTFYTWETGANDWNTITTMVDSSNQVLKFDPPIDLDYVHRGVVDATTGIACDNSGMGTADVAWDGARMNLNYNGFGDLWGIPGQCVDIDTGASKECDATSRWINAFSIPDGACGVFTDSNGTKVPMYLKALEKEERMVPYAGTAACASMAKYDLPSSADFVSPVIGTEPNKTSDPTAPIGSGAPSVIGGVIQ